MSNFPYKHIVIIGSTGSGKSTLAEQLAKKFNYDLIDLDALHWEPNWTKAPLEEFRERVIKATESDGWVIAGNYRSVRDLTWSKSEAVIWLDYSLPLIFGRLWKRTWRRWWYQEKMWNDNRESIWTHFKLWSDDSLFKWLLKTYWRRKREYPTLLSSPEYQHVKLLHFSDPNDTEIWLLNL